MGAQSRPMMISGTWDPARSGHVPMVIANPNVRHGQFELRFLASVLSLTVWFLSNMDYHTEVYFQLSFRSSHPLLCHSFIPQCYYSRRTPSISTCTSRRSLSLTFPSMIAEAGFLRSISIAPTARSGTALRAVQRHVFIQAPATARYVQPNFDGSLHDRADNAGSLWRASMAHTSRSGMTLRTV